MIDRRARAGRPLATPTPAVVALMVACAVVAFAPCGAAAATYRWVDADGQVRWSDRPPPAGTPLVPAPGPVAPAPGVAATSGIVATADQLLAMAGLDRQIPVLAAQLAEQLAGGLATLSPADRASARRLVQAGLDGERLRRAIHAELAHQTAPASMQAVAAWYLSPVGARIAAAAAALGTPEGQQQLATFVAQQQSAPPSPARTALVEQLDWLGGDVEATVDIVLAASRTMALTLNAALPAERRQPAGILGRRVDEARPRLVASMRGPLLSSLQFVYRDLSDDEVRQSIQFKSSPDARWFAASVKQAFTRAARDAAERSARELVRAIPPERWRATPAPSEVR